MAKLHLDRVDGVRGIAILLVFAYHTLQNVFDGYELNVYNSHGVLEINNLKYFLLNFNPFGQGWIGVELFLVISGFLIHLIHLRSGTALNLEVFFSKRFWRIYPPYLIVLLFFYVNHIGFSYSGLTNLFSHVLMIHNLRGNTFFTINPSFWSIALECQLYLIYPIYLALVKRMGDHKSLVLVLVINIIMSTIGLLAGINNLPYVTFVFNFWIVWCSGAYLANKFYNNQRMFNFPFLWSLFFFLLLGLFKSFYISSRFETIPATLFCLSLMEGILYNKNLDRLIIRHFFKLLSFIGICSYSIYLIHQPYLPSLLGFYDLGTHHFYLNKLVSVIFTSITVLLISYSLFKLVEIRSIEYGQALRKIE